jgi:hypothetical protein
MSSISSLSALQRAQALADTSAKPVLRNEQLVQPFIPTQDAGWTSSFDVMTGGYTWNPPKDSADTSTIFDQVGILTPVTSGVTSTFEQISTPSARTPGESKTVDPKFQISYRQSVANRTPGPDQPVPANHTPANLGRIGTNAGRLILLGTLDTDKEDVDTYTFDLQNSDTVHVLAPDPNSTDATASLGPVHMQVLDSKGNVFADSDPTSGEAYLNYVKLDQNALPGPEMDKGRYTIKLSYNKDAPADAKGDYSLFITQGSDPGRMNYYTAEKPPQKQTAPAPRTVSDLQSPALGIFA